MADWRYFEPAFWSEEDIQELTFEEKSFYIYLFTNEHCNQAGVYRITKKTIAFETGLTEERVEELLGKLIHNDKIIYKDCLLWVKSFVKHQPNTNPSVKKRIIKDLDRIEDEKIKEEFNMYYPELAADLAEISQEIKLTKRQIIAIRDGFICQYCGKKIESVTDLELDHIIPKIKGGKDTYDNLALSCWSCNHKKSDNLPQDVGFKFPSVRNYHRNRALKDLFDHPHLLSNFNDIFGVQITLKKIAYTLNILPTLGEQWGNVGDKSQEFPEVLVKGRVKGKGKEKEKEKDNNTSKQKQKIIFNFNNKQWENIAGEDIAQWREAYPACDVDLELKQMKEWLLSNPEKRKKNYRRFITNWLTRSQEKGGTQKGDNSSEREKDLTQAKYELGRLSSKDKILAWLKKLPEQTHFQLKKHLDRTYPRGHSYEDAKDEYEKNK